jgi:recombination protein RecT
MVVGHEKQAKEAAREFALSREAARPGIPRDAAVVASQAYQEGGMMSSKDTNAMVVVKKFRTKSYKAEIEKALPDAKLLTRFLRLASTALQKNPKLAGCTQESLRNAIIEAAHLGVVFDGTLGHASIIPFKGEAKFVLGYKGYIELGLRGGRVNHIETAVVHVNDEFNYQLGTDSWLRHIPAEPMDRRGERKGAWCVVTYPNGLKSFDYMQRGEIEAIRLKSPSGRSEWSAWHNHPGEMWRKTVLIRHMKSRGLSAEITKSASLEEAYEAGLGRTEKEIEAEILEQDKFGETMANGRDIAPTPVPSESTPVPEVAKTGSLSTQDRQAFVNEHIELSKTLGRKRPPFDTLMQMPDNTLVDAVEMLRQQVAEQAKAPDRPIDDVGDENPFRD